VRTLLAHNVPHVSVCVLHTVQTKGTSKGSSHEQTVMHLTPPPSRRQLLTRSLCKHLSLHICKSTVKISTSHYSTLSLTGLCVWQHCLTHSAFLKLQCFTNTRPLCIFWIYFV